MLWVIGKKWFKLFADLKATSEEGNVSALYSDRRNETFCGRETTEARADPETGTSVDHKAAVVQDSAEAQRAALVSMGVRFEILYRPCVSVLSQQTAVETGSNQTVTMHYYADLDCDHIPPVPYRRESWLISWVFKLRVDNHITSYPSEPILAFGAAHLWYQLEKNSDQKGTTALERYILPFFQKIMKRVVDVGNVGEVAACIFLLLAMDAAMMKVPQGALSFSRPVLYSKRVS
ncbi:hypothetical protein GQ600_6015 [Phytophthora cactorum]|nr:hypothetical protein GQ600_6015 [Phytophthora cactorum]